MSRADSIYLDNAATSFPKPESVYAAVDDYNRRLGVAVGRGAHGPALELQSIVARCRKRAADLLGAGSPERMAFTFNGTDSLNLALHGLLRPGDHVVTSVMEHNSVLRPLRASADRLGVEVTSIDADPDGRVEPLPFREALRPNTRLIAIVHASNVSGAVQPVEDIGQIAQDAGVLFLVDAAQSAGHLPIRLSDAPIDLLACSGHKGLLGPLGTGLLYVRPGVEEQLLSVRQGGTGTSSEDDRQPASLPDKYESGNHNAPGLCGLDAALAYLTEHGIEAIQTHEQELTARLLDGFASIAGLEIVGPRQAGKGRVGVVSVRVAGYDPHVLAAVLDEGFGIQTRAGLHCAPGAHRALGTSAHGGTVRFSTGPFSTTDHIDAAVAAVRALAAAQ